MKKILSLLLILGLCVGLVGCSNGDDSKETSQGETETNETVDRIGLTKAKAMLGVESAESMQEVGVVLEEEAPQTTDKVTVINYKAKKSGSKLQLSIKSDGSLTGAQVTGDTTDESEEFIALVSAITGISDFNIDSELYSKIGEVIKNKKEKEVIGDLTVGITTSGTTVKFFIYLNKLAEE